MTNHNSSIGSSESPTSYYLLKNLKVVSNSEYWDLHWKTGGIHSPAIKSSTNKKALLDLSKRMKNDRMDSSS